MMDAINIILQYLAAPLAAVVWHLYSKLNFALTHIAVIESRIDIDKTSHDREMKEMKETVKAIFQKLDNIEQALRK